MADEWWKPLGMSFPPRVTFGHAVMRARKAADLSQEGLAARLRDLVPDWNAHQTTIAKIEAGTRPVSIEEAHGLALALGVEPNVLISPAAPELAEIRALQYELSRAEVALTAACHRRNDVQRQLTETCLRAGIDVQDAHIVYIEDATPEEQQEELEQSRAAVAATQASEPAKARATKKVSPARNRATSRRKPSNKGGTR